MRALVTGTPLEVEGEPAEIAQLVELLSTGAVMVEHVHRFKLPPPDESDIITGSCWCGMTKEFSPYMNAPKPIAQPRPAVEELPDAPGITNVVRQGRTCGCGPKGKHGKNCALKVAA